MPIGKISHSRSSGQKYSQTNIARISATTSFKCRLSAKSVVSRIDSITFLCAFTLFVGFLWNLTVIFDVFLFLSRFLLSMSRQFFANRRTFKSVGRGCILSTFYNFHFFVFFIKCGKRSSKNAYFLVSTKNEAWGRPGPLKWAKR